MDIFCKKSLIPYYSSLIVLKYRIFQKIFKIEQFPKVLKILNQLSVWKYIGYDFMLMNAYYVSVYTIRIFKQK